MIDIGSIGAVVLLLLLMVLQATNPDMTDIRLIVTYWREHLVTLAGLLVCLLMISRGVK